MAMYADGISPEIRKRVTKINDVGLKRIVKFCDKNHHRLNLRRQIAIVRSVAQKGYTYASFEYGISKQAAEQALRRLYGIALEAEKEDAETENS